MLRLRNITLAVVVITLGAGYLAANRDKGPDSDQIMQVIARGRQGIEEKSLGKAMSCVSVNYNDEAGNKYDQVRAYALSAFRVENEYNVRVVVRRIQISEDTAVVPVSVDITISNDGAANPPITKEITLEFKKEKSRRYLIYPVREWKVTSMIGFESMIDSGGL